MWALRGGTMRLTRCATQQTSGKQTSEQPHPSTRRELIDRVLAHASTTGRRGRWPGLDEARHSASADSRHT